MLPKLTEKAFCVFGCFSQSPLRLPSVVQQGSRYSLLSVSLKHRGKEGESWNTLSWLRERDSNAQILGL